MSRTIDEKVVSMQFDNKQFESGVQTSLGTLGKLKESLKLKDAAKGLEDVDIAAKRMNFSPLSDGVETVKAKFSALEVMAVTALANITNSAVNAGKRLVTAFTIDPIKSGFQEYETQINAVQTILANTSSKGTGLDQVNAALDELNHYADKTIYNFTEMTRNIGTFTAAGVDLDTSVSAIKGIANLAAVSGSNSQQASTAMYQLSQALAAGTVKLQDWNSVVNAGMGGQVFQDALKDTARVHGIAIDEMIKDEGSFRETLSKGWLSSEILTETLSKFTGDLTEAQILQMGYTKEQAAEILKMGETANDAATKVKTFTQLMDTLKEAAQSGWTQSWEILIGDFEEAKALWTNVSDYFSEAINKSAEARNNLLQGWSDLGGRAIAIQSIKNVFEGLLNVVRPIKEAFREIFPPTTVKQLFSITRAVKRVTESFKEFTEGHAEQIKSTFKGLFSIVNIFKKVLSGLASGIGGLVGSGGVGSFVDVILNATAAIGEFFTSIDKGFDGSNFSSILQSIGEGIGSVVKTITDKIHGLGSIMPSIGSGIGKVISTIWNSIKSVISFVRDNISMGDIFAGLAGGGIFVAAKKFGDVFGTIKDVIDDFVNGSGKPGKLSEVFSSLHDSLQSFSEGIKIASIVSIAVAVGILSVSLRKISEINTVDIAKSIIAIGTMIAMLNISLKSMTKTLQTYDSKGLIKAGVSLVLLSTSLLILSSALKKVSEIPFKQLVKGLSSIAVMLVELTVALKIIDKVKIKLSTSIALISIAESCKILADALQKFGQLSWDEIARGLVAMGGALGELVIVVLALQKFGGFKSLISSIGILILVQSLSDLADALKKFGEMKWDEIGRGLAAMGGALAELVLALGVLGKVGGFSSIFAAGAILLVIQGLDDLADALKRFAEISWEEIGRGLTAMGGALGELVLALGSLSIVGGFSSIFAAGSILLVIQGLDDLANGLQKFGKMPWDEICRGLVAMGGALGEVVLFTGALGTIAGIGALIGAGSILLTIQGLNDLASALKKFGEMSWEEIGRGLVAMGAALGEVALITGGLGWVGGFAALVGAGSLLLAIQGLDDLANALKKFGEMPWEDVRNGLVAMGAALGEVALGSLANTLSGLGAGAIAEVAQPLGDLADSVKKWAGVTVPEGLGEQLGSLADGVVKFTFGGLGASAIAGVAEPLGTLADSVRNWASVIVPEGLGEQLSSLASGVESFSFAFMGGWSIGALAEPLGTLADSVRNWNRVKIPETLGTDLSSLASGIYAFSFAFMGGWSIGAITEPLSELADSVKKWNGVKIPEKLGTDLSSLASGVISFSLAFVGGWSIDTITGPLGDLADSVRKWNGIKISSDLTENLGKFGSAVGTFAINISPVASVDSANISSFASSIVSLNSAVRCISEVDSAKIQSFISAIKQLGGMSIDTAPLQSSAAAVSACIKQLISSVNATINASRASFSSSMRNAMQGMVTAVKSAVPQVRNAANIITQTLIVTIVSRKGMVTAAFRNLVSGGYSAIIMQYGSFVTAGVYLGQGLVEGINSMQQAVYNAAFALGQAAVQGEKDGQKSHSPSKATIQAGKWMGEGLVIGMKQMGNAVHDSGKQMGENAVDSISGALSRMKNVIESNPDIRPTISPVVDMSSIGRTNLQFGATVDAFMTRPIGTLSQIISSAQSEINASNNEVISAINGLREDLSNLYNGDDQEIALYVDSKKLATSLVKPMNRQLNILQKRGAY